MSGACPLTAFASRCFRLHGRRRHRRQRRPPLSGHRINADACKHPMDRDGGALMIQSKGYDEHLVRCAVASVRVATTKMA